MLRRIIYLLNQGESLWIVQTKWRNSISIKCFLDLHITMFYRGIIEYIGKVGFAITYKCPNLHLHSILHLNFEIYHPPPEFNGWDYDLPWVLIYFISEILFVFIIATQGLTFGVNLGWYQIPTPGGLKGAMTLLVIEKVYFLKSFLFTKLWSNQKRYIEGMLVLKRCVDQQLSMTSTRWI